MCHIWQPALLWGFYACDFMLYLYGIAIPPAGKIVPGSYDIAEYVSLSWVCAGKSIKTSRYTAIWMRLWTTGLTPYQHDSVYTISVIYFSGSHLLCNTVCERKPFLIVKIVVLIVIFPLQSSSDATQEGHIPKRCGEESCKRTPALGCCVSPPLLCRARTSLSNRRAVSGRSPGRWGGCLLETKPDLCSWLLAEWMECKEDPVMTKCSF